MSKDPAASFGGIAAVLETDPTLTAHLLKLGNSAAFGGAVPITGLRQALVRVGLQGFSRLLLIASTSDMLVVPQDPKLTARLQERATAVALASEEVARLVNFNRDSAFTAGVLHDVGRAMGWGLLRACRRWLSPALMSAPSRQTTLVSSMHEELGLGLTQGWRLPDPIQAAVGFHHRPHAAPPMGQGLAYAVALGASLCDAAGIAPDPDGERCDGRAAADALGLSVDAVRPIVATVRHKLGLPPRP